MSISIMGVKLWNRLDANVRIVKTIHIFNHIIKIMLISLYALIPMLSYVCNFIYCSNTTYMILYAQNYIIAILIKYLKI